MSYTVRFINSDGVEREIGKAESREECFSVIRSFLDERNFKSYYTRYWNKSGRTILDVGNHTEFFSIEPEF